MVGFYGPLGEAALQDNDLRNSATQAGGLQFGPKIA